MQWGSYVRNSRNSSQRVGVTEPHILGGTGMVHDLCFRTASSFHFWNIFQCLFIRNFILPMIGKFAIRYNKNAFSMTVKEKKKILLSQRQSKACLTQKVLIIIFSIFCSLSANTCLTPITPSHLSPVLWDNFFPIMFQNHIFLFVVISEVRSSREFYPCYVIT